MERMSIAQRVLVDDQSQVAEARRVAQSLGMALHFDESEIGQIAIAITEAASNILKHGERGELVFHSNGSQGLEVWALDKGRGMNVELCVEDGFSTSGSPGTGLGALARLSSGSSIYSLPGRGTVVYLRFARDEEPAPAPIELGGFSIPLEGEEMCGDGWMLHVAGSTIRVFVVDGLGHGLVASEAAREALSGFAAYPEEEPLGLFRRLHERMKKTRGAAAALAEIETSTSTVRFVGLGNIAGAVSSYEQTCHMVSMSGTLGHEMRTLREFTYPWTPDSLLILHSDGLSARWKLEDYPGLRLRPTSLIAGLLYRDMGRARDDATVLVGRMRQAGA